jgi:prevent-host-death family protein
MSWIAGRSWAGDEERVVELYPGPRKREAYHDLSSALFSDVDPTAGWSQDVASGPTCSGAFGPPFSCATMCYMRNTEMKVQRVGVRELRQNLSRYLRLVAEGERFEVTEHNLPVAVLGPLPGHSSPLARLIAEGRIVSARLDLTELGPPPEQPREMTISEALAAQREER